MKRILCLITAAVLVLCVCACGGNSAMSDGAKEVNLYFSNSDFNNIRAEKRSVTYSKEDVLAEIVVQKLLEGPLDVNNKAVIPKGTELIGYKAEGTTARADFNTNYLSFYGENAKSAELLARYSIVKTLCELPGIDRVEILVEGQPLMSSNGTPVGAIGEGDIVFDESSLDNETYKYVTLYFSNDMGEKLVSLRRRAPLVDNSMEKTVITELIKGPDGEGFYGTLPQGTKLLTVETKEKICFVNFSRELVDKFSGGSAEATMAIYSVVNSLTELDDIEKVQFLIDGEKVEWFGEYAFSEPFERDMTVVAD